MKRTCIPFARGIILVFILLLGNFNCAKAQDIAVARSLYQQKKTTEAKSMLESFKKGSVNYAESRYFLGRIAFDRKKYDEAEVLLEEAAELSPGVANYHLWYGNVCGVKAMQAGPVKQALYAKKIKNSFETVAKLDKKNVQARFMLIGFYTRAPKMMGGDINKAKEMADEIKTIQPEAGHRAWGQIYQHENQPDQAEKAYEKAISIAPDSVNCYYALGSLLVSLKKYDNAFIIYNKVMQRFPGERNVLFQYGRTSSLSGKNLAQGAEALDKFIKMASNPNESSLASAYYHRGQIYVHQGNKPGAKSQFETVLKLNSSHKQAKEALEKL